MGRKMRVRVLVAVGVGILLVGCGSVNERRSASDGAPTTRLETEAAAKVMTRCDNLATAKGLRVTFAAVLSATDAAQQVERVGGDTAPWEHLRDGVEVARCEVASTGSQTPSVTKVCPDGVLRGIDPESGGYVVGPSGQTARVTAQPVVCG
jgi:uncharacterized protein YceK